MLDLGSGDFANLRWKYSIGCDIIRTSNRYLPGRGMTVSRSWRFPALIEFFCGEDLWHFDLDFWERDMVETTMDVVILAYNLQI